MLEQKIEELSARVAELTAVMERMIVGSGKSAPAVKAEAPAPEEKVEILRAVTAHHKRSRLQSLKSS